MGRPVMKKTKKKGRPSLLDLQKRSLRLQKQHEQQQHQKQNPNPSTNPYARFPNPTADRRPARRNPKPEPDPLSSRVGVDDETAAVSLEDDEDEDEPTGRRKEKKLKLVHHLPHADANLSDSPYSASESEATGPKKRKINAVGKEEGKKSSKAAEDTRGEKSDLGPTTPLPDKHLLEFILDRLQKKDTYGVFSGPVDPDELPDYHDIIKHPMDFETVRNRLSSGVYTNLEQFENDVFLISSNAMRYNASDTIYFRQARSIHELAKKDFENLRQESDDSAPEPKIVRRGRPPGTGKNNFKRPVGKPPAETACSEYAEVRLTNAVNRNHILSPLYDFLRKGTVLHKPAVTDVSRRAAQCAQSSEAYIISTENKLVTNEDYSGSGWRGSSNSGKNIFATDEDRRDTYKQCPLSSTPEFPLLTALDGYRKILVPVALQMEHAYASSLARFAANLGPIGWKLASIRIKKALPPGTKFGPGWVGKSDPQPSLMFSTPSHHPSSKQEELPLNNESAKREYQIKSHLPPSLPSLSSSSTPENLPDANEVRAYSLLCQIPISYPTSNSLEAPLA